MIEARERLATMQAELVRALVAHGPIPAGFDAARIAAAARSLVNKRRQGVARVWPTIATALGESYAERFTAYAEAHPLPSSNSPLGDGRAFLAWLDGQAALTDELRVEAAAFDLRYVETPAGLRARRGFVVKMVKLRDKRLVAVRLPWLGERWWRLPLWGG